VSRKPTRARRLVRVATLVVALAALSLSGCGAPPPTQPLDAGGRRARYEDALATRERLATSVDEDLLMWTRLQSDARLPAVEASLATAAPGSFRLRVGGVLGTALDVVVRGDSATARIPSRRSWVVVPSLGDSLGVRDPAALVVRTWGALWRPPGHAWTSAVWRDSLLVASWIEDDDSVSVGVGSNGLPAWAERSREGRARVRARYLEWSGTSGRPWPSRLTLADAAGTFSVECRVEAARFAPRSDAARFALAPPPGTQALGFADLRRALARLGRL